MFTRTETEALIEEMEKGYYYEDHDVDKALDIWFPVWKRAAEKNRKMRSRKFLDCFNPELGQEDYAYIYNWIGDLECAFLGTGRERAEERIEFCTTMLEKFEMVDSMGDCRSNLADLYYKALDKKTEADALYEEIVRENPVDVFGWANYARLYAEGSTSDREKAYTIYKRGIETIQDINDIYENHFESEKGNLCFTDIDILYDEIAGICKSLGRDEEAEEWSEKRSSLIESGRERLAAEEPGEQEFIQPRQPKQAKQETVVNGPKIGRNAPCPCGSGKKYKKCCLNKAD